MERLREGRGEAFDAELQRVAGDPRRPAKDRLNAIRLLAANAPRLPEAFLMDLAGDSLAEVRSQAAWLAGLRPAVTLAPVLGRLLEDEDPFVRRRAAESLTRATSGEVIAPLVARLNDPDRLVRYVAMVALSHHRTGEWIEAALRAASPQARMRALVAAHLRREPVADDRAATVMSSLLGEELVSAEDQLDRLRLLGLVRSGLESRPELKSRVSSFLLDRFPSPHAPVRFEQARLLGEYRVEAAFGRLLAALEAEPDPVVQFHLAQALGRLPRGWTEAEQARLVKWLHRTQAGWFADLGDKGFEFPAFWNTVLESLVAHHAPALTRDLAPIDFGSALGGALMDALAAVPEKAGQLMAIYRANTNAMVQRRALLALGRSGGERAQRFLLTEYHRLSSAGANDAALASAILRGWAEKPDAVTMPFLVHEGLFHDDAEVVRAAAAAVVRAPALARRVLAEGEGPVGREPQALLAEELMTEMMRRPQLFRAYDQVLAVGAGLKREQGADRGRLDDAARQAGLQFWRDWFRQQFKREFQPVAESEPGRSDEALHRFLLSDAVRGGDAQRGRRVYEKAQCHTCHGGAGETRAALFGPDLAGVTRRLSRAEVADSLVYPSKQVAERFKAVEIELQDGEVLSGFVTEQTGEHVVLAERERVRRIPRGSIKAQRPQAASLMPAGLLAGLDWEEIRDLVAFLEEGQPPPAR
ncbi:MAG TPA: HEAT repeat domain-containing protein [Terriglobia bacterium]|nr:HEAT repeat domain-containing protein [Terriglobia bacterium]